MDKVKNSNERLYYINQTIQYHRVLRRSSEAPFQAVPPRVSCRATAPEVTRAM
ncbi:MAG: hypothetical protein MUE44_02825 [Oscillatoriaceae cyanobacterium Prado104]|nr:hypothetical protein [Oscillatoriaceae cyanobacterium Prado104]